MSTDDFRDRVEAFERRLAETDTELRRPGLSADAATLARLSEAVDALAADARDLHRQLAALVAVQERLAADSHRAADQPLAELAELDSDDLAPPERPRPLPIRISKLVVRSTLGLLRRVWYASHAPEAVEIRPRRVDGEAPLPRVSLVMVAAEPDLELARARLGPQTDVTFELVVWGRVSGDYVVADASGAVTSRGSAASPQELVAVVAGEYIADITSLVRVPEPSFVETIRWVMASEGLSVLELNGDIGLVVAARDLWGRRGVEKDALEALTRSRNDGVLGKSLTLGDPVSLEASDRVPGGGEMRDLVRRVGPWLVSRTVRGVVDHPLTLPRVQPVARADDDRPAVLVVVSAPLVAGLEQVVAGQLRALADRSQLVVVAAPGHGWQSGRRLRALGAITPYTYPIGELLARPMWLPLVVQIVRAHGVSAVLHVGDDAWWYARLGRLREAVAGLRVMDQPTSRMEATRPPGFDDIDHFLALTPGVFHRLVEGWRVSPDRVVQLTPLWAFPAPESGVDGRIARVRDELGVPEGARLLVTAADLVAASRVEDLVAVARRFQGDTDVWFVLEGDGPLDVAVAELVRLLAVERFLLVRPGHCPGDLVAAADVVCYPGESELPAELVVDGLAAGRPVVAAATAALVELGERLGGRGPLLVPRGDLQALEDGLRSALGGDANRAGDGVRDLLTGEVERAGQRLRQAVLGPEA